MDNPVVDLTIPDIDLRPDVLEKIQQQTSKQLIKKAGVTSKEDLQDLEAYVSSAKSDIDYQIAGFFAKYPAPMIIEHLTFTAIESGDLSTIVSVLGHPETKAHITNNTSFMTHALTFGTLDIVNYFLEIPNMLNFIKANPTMALLNAVYSGKSEIIERVLQIAEAIKYVVGKQAGTMITIANLTATPASYNKCKDIIDQAINKYKAASVKR